MHTRKLSPRVEYRLEQTQRIKDSISLAQKFPKLKSLTVDLKYFNCEGESRNGDLKYKANLEHAKALFCFGCPDHECVAGDFDLSKELARAVTARRKIATGEMRCLGWHHNAIKEKVPCENVLRYKLSLAY